MVLHRAWNAITHQNRNSKLGATKIIPAAEADSGLHRDYYSDDPAFESPFFFPLLQAF